VSHNHTATKTLGGHAINALIICFVAFWLLLLLFLLLFLVPWSLEDEFHVAIVTPVVHYSMGGVQINPQAQIVKPSAEQGKFGEPIKGLFAAGEVAGGVHGKNRLGGSGLLGCVVYGRVAGDSAAKFLLTQLTTGQANRRLGGISNQLAPGAFSITVNPSQNSFTVQLPGGDAAGAGAAASDAVSASSAASPAAQPAGSAPAAPAPSAQKKQYTYDEVAKHNTDKDCWVVVNGEVLDVTKFLDKHPGGKHAILLFAGKEVTKTRQDTIRTDDHRARTQQQQQQQYPQREQ
jgi:cytochrome b involved in lipid metabolism